MGGIEVPDLSCVVNQFLSMNTISNCQGSCCPRKKLCFDLAYRNLRLKVFACNIREFI